MTLNELPVGKTATVVRVGGQGGLRQHFLDMGIVPNAEMTLIKYAPMGDPMEFALHGYELTLRVSDAAHIEVKERLNEADEYGRSVNARKMPIQSAISPNSINDSPAQEKALPDEIGLTFALVGNQNSGKTTLFNRLTGSNQRVGNFPGVTVERKDGRIKGKRDTVVTDLPGIYSMTAYTNEEIVTREFLLTEKPKGIINVVDAANIERNLYLTMQLLELEIPMVLALNMMDEVSANGGAIDVKALEELLGIPVVPISAARNEGIDALIDQAVYTAKTQRKPNRGDRGGLGAGGDLMQRYLHNIMRLIEDSAKRADIPLRFAASKIAEGDRPITERLRLDATQKKMIDRMISRMEKVCSTDRSTAMAQMRFACIDRICRQTVIKPRENSARSRSQKIDKILTGKYTAIPAFIGIMVFVFWATFHALGAFLQNAFDWGISMLAEAVDRLLMAANVNGVLRSLVIEGIFGGVGSVLSFLPIIVTLFFFLSLMEDSGYMARVAFVMDKPLRRLGLSGRSIVPMLIGFGCTVPGVMAARTLPSERDRKLTVLLTPYMSCSAKLPIYLFFTKAFFPKQAVPVMIALYLLGIMAGIGAAVCMKRCLFTDETVPFVMELPDYRMPSVKNVARLLWDKAKDYLQRVFSVVFIATVVIWFLQTFDLHLNRVIDPQSSILAALADLIAPIFKPLGFGDWRITTALISGFMAKESVVSTVAVLFGSMQALQEALAPVSALSLLVFCLLYTPCVAAVTSIRRELNGRWAVCVAVGQCIIAWISSWIVCRLGCLFG